MKTNPELKKLAMDIVNDNVFTSYHLIVNNDEDLIPSIFMPIMLGAFKTEEEAKKVNMIYEYLDKAENRSINGYPIFMSFQYLTHEEYSIIQPYLVEYQKLKENFINE